MATRTSDMISQKYYQGSWRGRPIAYNIDYAQFPQKYEYTNLNGDNPAEQLYEDRRDTLKDLSPEQTSLFPYEEPRRDTKGRWFINLRDGYFGAQTDPWANSGQNGGDGFDISFHDQDPRGWSLDQNWREYRRLAEAELQNTDFKDDGSYDVPSSMIHPNTYYKMIRGTQDWIKARMKVFSEEWEGRSNGGAGVYPETSKVYRSDFEDSSGQTEGLAPSRTFDDPEISQHHNVNISNLVHLGGKYFRVNTTTDHLVKVAAYNKLYKSHGLLDHETQLRIIEDDTPWGKLENQHTPKNLVRMMASQIYSDNPNISPYTASEISRILMQEDQTESGAYQGNSREELRNGNRSQNITKDIMALFGFTAHDIKHLESMKDENRTTAQHTLQHIKRVAEYVHKLPVTEKLAIRNELILKAAGGGLTPASGSDLRNAQQNVIVNPKIVEFMSQKTRNSQGLQDPALNADAAIGDPENKLNNKLANMAVHIYKSAPNPENVTAGLFQVSRSAEQLDTTRRTADYKNLTKFSQNPEANRASGIITQIYQRTLGNPDISTMPIGNYDFQENLRNTALDNNFGENRGLVRHVGRIGTKNMRRYMDSDYVSPDNGNELGARPNKNTKNRNALVR